MRIVTYLLSLILLQSVLFSAPATAQVINEPAAGEYRINSGDELEIYVWGEERLQRPVRVLPDGTITFPLVGQIVAQNLLTQELEREISNRLVGQYRGEVPQVTVSVVSPAGLQFSVMGRVKSPGTFTPGRYVNVLEALSMAGGPSEFANLDAVVIIRQVESEMRSFRLRLGAVVKGTINPRDRNALSSVVRIEPGDTVIVP